MKALRTPKGFVRITFRDHFDRPCSITESRTMIDGKEVPMMWFGQDHARMYLSPENVLALLGPLAQFAEGGNLGSFLFKSRSCLANNHGQCTGYVGGKFALKQKGECGCSCHFNENLYPELEDEVPM